MMPESQNLESAYYPQCGVDRRVGRLKAHYHQGKNFPPKESGSALRYA